MLLAFLVACGAATTPGPVAPPPTRPLGASTASAPLPLEQYTQTADQATLVGRASEILVQRCMRERGFDYTPRAIASAPNVAPPAAYGITNPEHASSHGYAAGGYRSGAGGGDADLPDIEDINVQISQLGRGYVEALYGAQALPQAPNSKAANETPGCIDIAFRRIFEAAPPSANLELVGELSATAAAHTQSDARVVRVLEAWSECMKERGFAYPTPMEAKEKKWPPGPGAEEIATAQADVACKQAVDLVRTWRAVEAAYQERLIERNAAALAEARDANEAIGRNAESLLRIG